MQALDRFCHNDNWKAHWYQLYKVSSLLLCCEFSFLFLYSFFSVSIFCAIGLPGFASTVGLTVVAVLSMLLSLAVIDKVGYIAAGLQKLQVHI